MNRLVKCRVCGLDVDPTNSPTGDMHPACEAENYRRNIR